MVQDHPQKIKYVSSFVDNRGTVRWRFRKAGQPTHYFTSPPGTPRFENDYRICLEDIGELPKKLRKPPSQSRPLVRQARNAMRAFPGAKSFVYFVRPDRGPVKIGLATNPDRRLKDIQVGNHAALKLLALIPGSPESEREYHARLAKWRISGEWFSPTAEVLAVVNEVRDLANRQKHQWLASEKR